MKTRLLLASAMLVIAFPAPGCDLSIANPWVREPLPGVKALAAYGTLSNAGKTSLTIASVTSADFKRVETHETITVNGVGKMRAAVIEVPAGGTVTFMPGGRHFMLIEPQKPLKAGDAVVLQMTDSAGCKSALQFIVGNHSPAPVNGMAGMK